MLDRRRDHAGLILAVGKLVGSGIVRKIQRADPIHHIGHRLDGPCDPQRLVQAVRQHDAENDHAGQNGNRGHPVDRGKQVRPVHGNDQDKALAAGIVGRYFVDTVLFVGDDPRFRYLPAARLLHDTFDLVNRHLPPDTGRIRMQQHNAVIPHQKTVAALAPLQPRPLQKGGKAKRNLADIRVVLRQIDRRLQLLPVQKRLIVQVIRIDGVQLAPHRNRHHQKHGQHRDKHGDTDGRHDTKPDRRKHGHPLRPFQNVFGRLEPFPLFSHCVRPFIVFSYLEKL